jgi:hypothetical protein
VRVGDAATIRLVISSPLHAQLGVDAGDDDVERGEQLVLLVERAVVEDVDLDAGEDAERRERSLRRRRRRAARRSRSRAQAVGDREPRRVVGEDHVLVAEVAGRAGHLLDREPPSDQSECSVAVAAQPGCRG